MAFLKTPTPHVFGRNSVSSMMITVMLATVPALLAQIFFFGWGSLIQVILAIVIAMIAEAGILVLRDKPIKATLVDGSAALTGLLIGLSLPSIAPWWITFSAVVFAIVFAKHLYGGLGYNPFNPAMVGYVLVLISFPLQMTSWLPASSLLSDNVSFGDSFWLIFTGHSLSGIDIESLRTGIDGFTMATPLDTVKTDLASGFMASESVAKSIFTEVDFLGIVGKGWWVINFMYLLGGLVLIYRKVIGWQIPLSMIVTLGLISIIFNAVSVDLHAPTSLHLFSGATMFAAFFIATDPVSASTTPRGRIYYGIGIGLLIYIIRTFGGYPDAVAFAVLLMNMAAPTIDHFTAPMVYGHKPQNMAKGGEL
jgi:electron transport complex protein RnfD